MNPYAELIDLPDEVFKPRRTLLLLLSFIETITFYHQYQRSIKTDSRSGIQYVEIPKSAQAIRSTVIAEWLKTKDIRIVQYMAGHRWVSSTERYNVANLRELKESGCITKCRFH